MRRNLFALIVLAVAVLVAQPRLADAGKDDVVQYPETVQEIVQPPDLTPAVRYRASTSNTYGNKRHLVEWVANNAAFGSAPAYIRSDDIGFYTPAHVNVGPGLSKGGAGPFRADGKGYMIGAWADTGAGSAAIVARGSGYSQDNFLSLRTSGKPGWSVTDDGAMVFHAIDGWAEQRRVPPSVDGVPSLKLFMETDDGAPKLRAMDSDGNVYEIALTPVE